MSRVWYGTGAGRPHGGGNGGGGGNGFWPGPGGWGGLGSPPTQDPPWDHFGGWHPGPGDGGSPGHPGPVAPTDPGTGTGGGDLNSTQQSIYDMLAATLTNWGLASLIPTLKDLILQGITSEAELQLALQNTPEWKQRFAGNEMLRQKGLSVLSVGEYLATERSYAQIMHNFGLPSGFYDDPSDFAKWIGNSVSAAELQQRVSSYSDLMNRSEDPAIQQQLSSMGLGTGDLLAMWMDPERAMPLVQQKYQTALLGAAARRSGVVADNGYLGQLAARGVSEQQAAQGYGLIAGSLSDANTLSHVYGVDYGLNDMQAEVFDNSGDAQKKRRRLASQERASFSGTAGVGSLTQNSAGSY